jgi:Thaumatin family
MARRHHTLLFLSIFLLLSCNARAATLALFNKCGETVWPGIQPGAGHPILARGGLELRPGQATSLRLPPGWSGRVWGRQGCQFNPTTSTGKCATGDCGGQLYCNGIGGAPPATLAEITLSQSATAQDFYDVSLVDGYVRMMWFLEGLINKGKNVLCYLVLCESFLFSKNREKDSG